MVERPSMEWSLHATAKQRKRGDGGHAKEGGEAKEVKEIEEVKEVEGADSWCTGRC